MTDPTPAPSANTSASNHVHRGGPRLRRLVGGTIAVVVVAVLACEGSGWRFLRSPLQKAIHNATGAPVEITGRFRLHLLWRANLQAQRVYVGAAPGFGVPFLVDGTGLRLDWRWLDLWRWRRGGDLRIKSVQADTLYANLVRLPDGRATWQLGQKPGAEVKAPDHAPSPVPRVGLLRLGKGELKLDDAITRTRLLVTVTGGEGERVGTTGSGYAITAKGQFRDLPLNLRARVGGALPLVQDDADGANSATVPVHVEGEGGDSKIWFDGTAAALMTAHRVSGNLRFSGPSLAAVGDPLGVTLPRTPAFELRGHIAHDAGVWQLKADPATVGDSQLAGDFRYDSNASPPKLSGQLRGPRLLLSDLGPAVGTPGEGASGKTKKPKNGKVLPDSQFDLPSLRGMDADVQVAIDLLDLGTDALAPLRQLQTHVLLQGGVLRLDDLKAVVAGGNVTGATRLDATGDPARWAANLSFNRLDLAGWITGVRKPAQGASAPAPAPTSAKVLTQERQQALKGEEQPAKAYLTGELTGKLQVTGQGRSTAEILGTLNGGAEATLRDGTISHLVTELAGLDIAQALGVLIKGDRPLPLRCARVDMAVQNGVVVPRQAVFDNRDSTVRVAGHIDLRTEGMELRAVTRPKDISPLALRAPVLVRGTLGDPSVGIEAKALTGRAAAAAALATVVAPLAAVLPFVDMGDKESGDPCAPLPPSPGASATSGSQVAQQPGMSATKPAR